MSKKQTLLITGGTGSFGNAVLNRFLNEKTFTEIRIFSRDEKKQDSMRQFYNNSKIKYFIGDVRNSESVNVAMKDVDMVFHAAALKQVPSCEFFPMEAVRTNIIGVENVLNSAIKEKVKSAIILSTDKAVYPINAMGMTKALSEKVMVAKSRDLVSSSIFSATRYGNVMASRGSVIPLIINQIKEGKDITLTDPKMTRFMMTLDQAVELVWYAYKNSNNGDIFVQKSPSSTIETLAIALKEIYNANNPIKIIGTRHGEKLFETLINREEMFQAEDLGDYFRLPSDSRSLNYTNYYSKGQKDISEHDDYTSHNTKLLDVNELKKLLLELPIIKNDINNNYNIKIYNP